MNSPKWKRRTPKDRKSRTTKHNDEWLEVIDADAIRTTSLSSPKSSILKSFKQFSPKSKKDKDDPFSDSNSLPEMKTLKNPIRVGFLKKRGVRAFKRNWKIRYCMIHEGFFYWSKSKQDDFPLGRIPLTEPGLKITLVNNKTFEISRSTKSYEFQSSNWSEMQEWLQHLRKAIACNDILVRSSGDWAARQSITSFRDSMVADFDVEDQSEEAKEEARQKKIIKLLHKGSKFLRYNRKGHQKFDMVHFSEDLTKVYYGERGRWLKSEDIECIKRGRQDPGFVKYDHEARVNATAVKDRTEQDKRSYSVIFRSDKGNNALNLEANNEKQLLEWVEAFIWLKDLMDQAKRGLPFNVKHLTHVDTEFKWSGENLEDIFEITRKLGEGAFGEVFLAVHKESKFQIAIKMLEVENATVADEIRGEIDILKQCKHQSIVSYYGCWGPDSMNRLWILMDFCEVGSAVSLIKHSKVMLNEAQIAFVCASTLLALVYLHANHILHRDVKGENIMIMKNGDVKLADFGVSKHLAYKEGEQAEDEREVVGSPLWMAPEVIEGEGSHKSDVWSLGITAIEIAERRLPHSGMRHASHIIQMISISPPPMLKGDHWSDDFKDFVRTCLVKDPTERIDAIQLLTHPFVVNAHDPNVIKDVVARCLSGNKKEQTHSKGFFKKKKKENAAPTSQATPHPQAYIPHARSSKDHSIYTGESNSETTRIASSTFKQSNDSDDEDSLDLGTVNFDTVKLNAFSSRSSISSTQPQFDESATFVIHSNGTETTRIHDINENEEAYSTFNVNVTGVDSDDEFDLPGSFVYADNKVQMGSFNTARSLQPPPEAEPQKPHSEKLYLWKRPSKMEAWENFAAQKEQTEEDWDLSDSIRLVSQSEAANSKVLDVISLYDPPT